MKKALPVIGILLVTGGLALLGWATWAHLSPRPAPFEYALISEGTAEAFPDLGIEEPADLTVRQYELRAAGAKRPVATLHVGRRDTGSPVLLDWRNHASEPVLSLSGPVEQTVALARAVAEYVPAQSVVLAWWDTSRRLGLLAGCKVLFDENLAQPLLIPTAWQDRRDSIEAFEREFWDVPGSAASQARFARFVEALVSDEATGVGILRELVGGREAYVVVHMTDAYKLGAMRPDRFGIGYKDFPASGQVHGLVKHVKHWVEQNGYESYAVSPRGAQSVRVYFLTDAASSNTLLARMLPFSTSNPMTLEEPGLVYQRGDYWVYKLPPREGEDQ